MKKLIGRNLEIKFMGILYNVNRLRKYTAIVGNDGRAPMRRYVGADGNPPIAPKLMHNKS